MTKQFAFWIPENRFFGKQWRPRWNAAHKAVIHRVRALFAKKQYSGFRNICDPLNIKCTNQWLLYQYLSVTSHIKCIVARCLINVVYLTPRGGGGGGGWDLTACAFIRSWWRCIFECRRLWRWIYKKWSLAMGKLIHRTSGIKFTSLGFEDASWIARQASQCQQAFSKPCLVNLISKDTHLVFSMYGEIHQYEKY